MGFILSMYIIWGLLENHSDVETYDLLLKCKKKFNIFFYIVWKDNFVFNYGVQE